MICLKDVCNQALVEAEGTDGLVLKQPPVPVDLVIPFIILEHELIPIASKITLLK